MKLLLKTFLPLAVGLLASCGGGGGSGTATPTTSSVQVVANGLQGTLVVTQDTVDPTKPRVALTAASPTGTFENIAIGGYFSLAIDTPSSPNETCQIYEPNRRVKVTSGANKIDVVCSPTGQVVAFAGTGEAASFDGPLASAKFNQPRLLAVDGNGVIYVSESTAIRTISPSGNVATLNIDRSNGEDGLEGVGGLRVTSDGTVFFTQTVSYATQIRKRAPNGLLTTIAGGSSGYQNGSGTQARFNYPEDLVVDAYGYIYVADTNNHVIRRVSMDGAVTTFAGSGQAGLVDGIGTLASFNKPSGLALDAWGNLYVADSSNHAIRKITPGGLVSTVFSNNTPPWYNGPKSSGEFPLQQTLNYPTGVVFDNAGTLYVSNYGSNFVAKINSNGKLTLVAGLPTGDSSSSSGDVSSAYGTDARFRSLKGLLLTPTGELFVTDRGNNKIKKILLPN